MECKNKKVCLDKCKSKKYEFIIFKKMRNKSFV